MLAIASPALAQSITVSVDTFGPSGSQASAGSLPIGAILPGDAAVAEARITVTTTASGGYQLFLSGDSSAAASGTSSIPWASVGTAAAPQEFTGDGMAISAFGGATTPDRWCNGGRAQCPSSDHQIGLSLPALRWAALGTDPTVVTENPGPTTGDATRIPVRLQVPAEQPAGSYSGGLVVTVIAIDATPTPTNTVPPEITGSAVVGSLISASTGTWTPEPDAYAFTWLRCQSDGSSCSSIAGATAASYGVTAADIGAVIRVQVTATNAGGSTTEISGGTSPVPQPGGAWVRTAATASAKSGGTTLTMSVPADGIPAGRFLVIGTVHSGNVAVGYRDTQGNAASVSDDTRVGSSGYRSDVLGVPILAPLGPSDTITITFGGNVTPRAAIIDEFAGVLCCSPLDRRAGAAASGTGSAVSSGATGQTQFTSELLYGGVGINGPAGEGFTPGSTYTARSSAGTTGGQATSNAVVRSQSRVVHATGAYLADATLGTARAWTASIATYVVGNGSRVTTSTAAPTVSGTAREGQLLTTTNGAWDAAPDTLAYRWQRCDSTGANCTTIVGATSATRLLEEADAGFTVRSVVISTGPGGFHAAVSAPTPTVLPLPPTNTAPPTATGTADVEEALTATTGSWTGSPTSYGYQWRRCDAAGANCTDVVGATSATYTTRYEDQGYTMRVVVTATNAGGSTAATSAATTVITCTGACHEGAIGEASANSSGTTLVISIGQSVAVGRTIVLAVGARDATSAPTISDARGNVWGAAYSHTWSGSMGVVQSTVAWGRVVHSMSAGDTITVRWPQAVTGRAARAELFRGVLFDPLDAAHSAGGPPSVTTSFTTTYARALAFNLDARIYGSGQGSSGYTLSPAGWYQTADGFSGGNGQSLVSASRRFLRLRLAQAVSVELRGSNWEAAATMVAYRAVDGLTEPPANAAAPSVSGTAQQGQTLIASSGTWSGAPTSFAYRWMRCSTAGASCAPIAGASGNSYVATAADVGATLRAYVFATNAGGSIHVASEATPTIVA